MFSPGPRDGVHNYWDAATRSWVPRVPLSAAAAPPSSIKQTCGAAGELLAIASIWSIVPGMLTIASIWPLSGVMLTIVSTSRPVHTAKELGEAIRRTRREQGLTQI